jgi:hypothetical protein
MSYAYPSRVGFQRLLFSRLAPVLRRVPLLAQPAHSLTGIIGQTGTRWLRFSRIGRLDQAKEVGNLYWPGTEPANWTCRPMF